MSTFYIMRGLPRLGKTKKELLFIFLVISIFILGFSFGLNVGLHVAGNVVMDILEGG
jgi:hypothetical protein